MTTNYVTPQIKNLMSFKPGDVHGMSQAPKPHFKMPGVDRISGYRYPAPASQRLANVPYSNPDKTYDIGYFKRDSRQTYGTEYFHDL